jgi:hypothetical protein
MSTGEIVGISVSSAFTILFVILMERARAGRAWGAFTAYGALTFLAASVALLSAGQVAGVTPDDLATVLDKLLPFLKK